MSHDLNRIALCPDCRGNMQVSIPIRVTPGPTVGRLHEHDVDWNADTGDSNKWFCPSCEKHQFPLELDPLRTFTMTWFTDGMIKESIVCTGPGDAGMLKCVQAAVSILQSYEAYEEALEAAGHLLTNAEYVPDFATEMKFYLTESRTIPHDEVWNYDDN